MFSVPTRKSILKVLTVMARLVTIDVNRIEHKGTCTKGYRHRERGKHAEEPLTNAIQLLLASYRNHIRK